MKILLDEFRGQCAKYWPSIRVQVCNQKAGVVFGTVCFLKRAQDNFDLLITADQSIHYQQNLSSSTIAILELSTNDL